MFPCYIWMQQPGRTSPLLPLHFMYVPRDRSHAWPPKVEVKRSRRCLDAAQEHLHPCLQLQTRDMKSYLWFIIWERVSSPKKWKREAKLQHHLYHLHLHLHNKMSSSLISSSNSRLIWAGLSWGYCCRPPKPSQFLLWGNKLVSSWANVCDPSAAASLTGCSRTDGARPSAFNVYSIFSFRAACTPQHTFHRDLSPSLVMTPSSFSWKRQFTLTDSLHDIYFWKQCCIMWRVYLHNCGNDACD